MTGPGESKKMAQNQPKLKVIIYAFGCSWGSSSECHGMPPTGMGRHWKRVMWIETNMWMLYVHFETVLNFTRNEQMGVFIGFFEAIEMLPSAKHPRNVTTHFGFLRNFSGENLTRLREFQKCLKNSQSTRL